MKILLDECVPWPMHRIFTGHSCTMATKRGWGGGKNGDLIRLAEAEFDLFITSDQNIRYQQKLSGRRIAIMELSTNDLRRIMNETAGINQAMEKIQSGDYLRMEIP